jgi:hypothetical protein
MEESNINLMFNELGFTNVCKEGFIRYIDEDGYRKEFYLSKLDILYLLENSNILKKFSTDTINIFLNIDKETIKEIIKRSPLYSNLLD